MTHTITHHRDGFLSLCWFWHWLFLQELFAPKLLHCFPRVFGLMNKQLFSQALPLQIFYLEKSIKGLCHVLQTLVQEQLTWVREGEPLIFVRPPGFSKQATRPSLLVLISRLGWERLFVRVCPSHPQSLSYVLASLSSEKLLGKSNVQPELFWVWLFGFMFLDGGCRVMLPSRAAFLSHNCFPGLLLCGTGVLHYNSFFTPRAVRG